MDVSEIREQVKASTSIVFFGGAGTSTESNIPDFRTKGGLYSQQVHGRSPEELLSAQTLEEAPELFFDYYRKNLVHTQAQPNKTHEVLARWEKEGKLKAIITQNIDGLHQKAGSRHVLELHGSLYRNYCTACYREASLEEVLDDSVEVPSCRHCDGMIRPDVVLYGESLDMRVLHQAVASLQNADLLIVGGTSLVVYPAAGLINYFQGENLLLINRDATSYDDRAKWVIHDSIGEVLSQLDWTCTEPI